MRNLYDALQEHLDAAAQEVNKDQIFGVFLYGSQNYGTDLEDSDVDTKAIYVPTFEECLFKSLSLRKLSYLMASIVKLKILERL